MKGIHPKSAWIEVSTLKHVLGGAASRLAGYWHTVWILYWLWAKAGIVT